MHPFTFERLQQEAEYEAALRADIQREEETERSQEHTAVEETSETENDIPLTIDELRSKRLQYFTRKDLSSPSQQCTCMTRDNLRCKNKVNIRGNVPERMCHIHYKKFKKG